MFLKEIVPIFVALGFYFVQLHLERVRQKTEREGEIKLFK